MMQDGMKYAKRIEGPRAIVGLPQIKYEKLSKKFKNGLKIVHCTLPSHPNFLKSEFSTAHEMNFKHSFKIWGAKSTFVG